MDSSKITNVSYREIPHITIKKGKTYNFYFRLGYRNWLGDEGRIDNSEELEKLWQERLDEITTKVENIAEYARSKGYVVKYSGNKTLTTYGVCKEDEC